MKKRLISLFVALTMLLCLIPAAFAATFNAGTYTASANGMNGAVTVEVTFSDSAITDVKVTEQAETPAIASGALEQIPADIVAHQTLAVDTVTGATITSKAILAAVEDCVKQAGADPDTLRTPVEKNTADVGDRTAHVEVLVIGGDVVASISKRPDLRPIVDILDDHGDEIFRNADSIALEIDCDKEIVKAVFYYAEKYRNLPFIGVLKPEVYSH